MYTRRRRRAHARTGIDSVMGRDTVDDGCATPTPSTRAHTHDDVPRVPMTCMALYDNAAGARRVTARGVFPETALRGAPPSPRPSVRPSATGWDGQCVTRDGVGCAGRGKGTGDTAVPVRPALRTAASTNQYGGRVCPRPC